MESSSSPGLCPLFLFPLEPSLLLQPWQFIFSVSAAIRAPALATSPKCLADVSLVVHQPGPVTEAARLSPRLPLHCACHRCHSAASAVSAVPFFILRLAAPLKRGKERPLQRRFIGLKIANWKRQDCVSCPPK